MKEIQSFLTSLPNEETRLQIIKIVDQMLICQKRGTPVVTDFYDPYIRSMTKNLIPHFSITMKEEGGFVTAERKRLVFEEEGRIYKENSCSCLEIISRFSELGHRDVLGSLLSLGIKREKIGDIRPKGNTVRFIVAKELKEYISSNLVKVRREGVSCHEILEDEKWEVSPSYQIFDKTVASLRADVVVAAIYSLSREQAKKVIEQGLLRMNYKPILKVDTTWEGETLFSLRGYGRVTVHYMEMKSKKGRLIIRCKKWMD